MIDITKCYVVMFTDEAGSVHSVPFPMAEGGNGRANKLVAALKEIGLPVQKYGHFKTKG